MKKRVFFLAITLLAINLVIAQNYAPGELIVKYKDNAVGLGSKVIVNNKLISYDNVEKPIQEEKIVEGIELYNLKFNENVNILEIAKEYKSMKEVEYAEPNFIMENFFVPNDANYSSLYWTKSVNAENAWDLTIGNKNVKIGILDTGVDWNHPDLYENIWNSSDSCNSSLDLNNNNYKGDCRGYDFVDINVANYINEGYSIINGEDYNVTDNNPMDFDGHGTHVAGIAGAVGNNNLGVIGSCWNCSIVPIRAGFSIISQSGKEIGSLEVDDVVSAIYYAVDNNITILSMSFGGKDSKSVEDAVEYAYNKGVILVASAGNSGTNDKQYPCAYDEVICVSAINSDDSPAGYSNYGDWVDLTAPGTGILSTKLNGGYFYSDGTSMSAPLVSGMIGLIKSLYEKNQTQIVKSLKNTGSVVNFSGTLINKTNIYSAILSFDNSNPIVNLVSPLDESLNSSLSQNFVCNASDLQLQNISLKIWNSGNLFYNETKNISGHYNSTNFAVNLNNYSYEWNCLVYDANNNKAYAPKNFSFSTAIIKEEITNNFPENNSYTNLSNNLFSCNINTNNKTVNNITFILNDANGIIYQETKSLTGFSNSSSFNYGFIDDGIYYWSCNAYANNVRFLGDKFTLNYDSKKPVIEILNPENNKIYSSKEVEFSFNVNENSNCNIYVNDNIEYQISNTLNGNFNKEYGNGSYSWKVSCEDYAKNKGESETRNFIIKEQVSSSEGNSSGESGGSPVSGSVGSSGAGVSGSGGSTSVSAKSNSENSNQNTDENIENLNNSEKTEKSDITGFAVDKLDTNLNILEKYKNRINIFVVIILISLIFLFYIDFKYEKRVSKEIELLEKE